MSFTPHINDDATIAFADRIRNDSAIRMRRKLELPNYDDDRSLVTVPNQPRIGAEVFKCWFNCLREEQKGAGQVVYGWALWCERTPHGIVFFSQHHAVLRTASGLMDITPYVDENGQVIASPITFLIDGRVPFDIERNGFPASLVWDTNTADTFWAYRSTPTANWERFPDFMVLTAPK